MSHARDTAILKVVLHQGRETVPIGEYPFPTRAGAIVGAAVDQFIRKILEGKCPNPDE